MHEIFIFIYFYYNYQLVRRQINSSNFKNLLLPSQVPLSIIKHDFLSLRTFLLQLPHRNIKLLFITITIKVKPELTIKFHFTGQNENGQKY